MPAQRILIIITGHLFGQERLQHGDLSRLFGSQIGTVLLRIYRSRLGPLLGQLRNDLQHLGIGQFGDTRRSGLRLDNIPLRVAQRRKTYGILGLHSLHDSFGNFLF